MFGTDGDAIGDAPAASVEEAFGVAGEIHIFQVTIVLHFRRRIAEDKFAEILGVGVRVPLILLAFQRAGDGDVWSQTS